MRPTWPVALTLSACGAFGAMATASGVARADEDEARCGTACPEGEPHGGVLARSGVDAAVGVRASLTRARGTSGDDQVAGVTLSGRGEGYMARGWATGRASHFFAIGGGGGGFEAALDMDVAIGVRASVTAYQGPFVRLGMRGWLMGNGSFYTSFVEVPQGQLGWQWVRGTTVLELAARGGPVLVGRFNPGDASEHRNLGGSVEWGGHAAIHAGPVRFHLAAMRVEAKETGDGSPVEQLRGDLCGAAAVAICVDTMVMRGGLPLVNGAFSTATVTYGGLLVGWVPRDEP